MVAGGAVMVADTGKAAVGVIAIAVGVSAAAGAVSVGAAAVGDGLAAIVLTTTATLVAVGDGVGVALLSQLVSRMTLANRISAGILMHFMGLPFRSFRLKLQFLLHGLCHSSITQTVFKARLMQPALLSARGLAKHHTRLKPQTSNLSTELSLEYLVAGVGAQHATCIVNVEAQQVASGTPL